MLGRAPIQDNWQLRDHGLRNQSRRLAATALERAFPDFNCHRVQDGQWRLLGEDWEQWFTGPNSLRTASSKNFKLRWRRGIRRLAMRHGFAHGSLAAAAGNFSQQAFKRSCPLGAATLAAAELLSSLLRFFEFHRFGKHQNAEREVEAYLAPASREITTLIERIPTMWLLVFLLPATRWPLLDLLAAIEHHVLPQRVKGKHHSCIMEPSESTSGYTALLPLLRRIAQDSWLDTTSGPQVHGFSGANEVSEVLKRAVHGLSSQQYIFALQQGAQCWPLALQQRIVTALVLLERNVPITTADPDAYFRELDEDLRHYFFNGEDFWRNLVVLPFETFPFLGFWLRMR
eukprot:symbB.v1.2.030500.t1/scaffold3435.1/size56750/10